MKMTGKQDKQGGWNVNAKRGLWFAIGEQPSWQKFRQQFFNLFANVDKWGQKGHHTT